MRELEAWAYQQVGNTQAENELWDIVGRMIAAEREACAKIADAMSLALRLALEVQEDTDNRKAMLALDEAALRIRTRGED